MLQAGFEVVEAVPAEHLTKDELKRAWPAHTAVAWLVSLAATRRASEAYRRAAALGAELAGGNTVACGRCATEPLGLTRWLRDGRWRLVPAPPWRPAAGPPRTPEPTAPPAEKQTARVTVAILLDPPVVLVSHRYRDASGVERIAAPTRRRRVVLQASTTCDNVATFAIETHGGALVDVYESATGGAPLETGRGHTLAGGFRATTTREVYLEARAPSAHREDVHLTLALGSGSSTPGPPARRSVTAVRLTLEVCAPRAAVGRSPQPLANDAKRTVGRYVHVQVYDQQQPVHGRAKLIVRRPEPHDWSGDLHLDVDRPRPNLGFADDEQPYPGRGLRAPLTIAAAELAQYDRELWVEGVTASDAPGDAPVRLGIDLAQADLIGDWVRLTVVAIESVRAAIWETPPLTPRPVTERPDRPAVWFVRGITTGSELVSTLYSARFEHQSPHLANHPLVLIHGSLPASHPVFVAAVVRPTNIPSDHYTWHIARADDDTPAVRRLVSLAVPTLDPGGGPEVRNEYVRLHTDAVGSFHLWLVIDPSLATPYDPSADRPPLAVLNVVLAHVRADTQPQRIRMETGALDGHLSGAHQFIANSERSDGTSSAGGTPTGDAWSQSLHRAIRLEVPLVITGGLDGSRGRENVFGGWVQFLRAEGSRARYRAGAVERSLHAVYTSTTTGRQSISGLPNATYFPATGVRPALLNGPLSDGMRRATGTANSGGTGTATPGLDAGGVAACMALGDWDRNGERLLARGVDGPSSRFPTAHPQSPAGTPLLLFEAHFGLEFEVHLCAWTQSFQQGVGYVADPDDPGRRLFVAYGSFTWQLQGEWRIDTTTISVTPGPTHRGITMGTPTWTPGGRATIPEPLLEVRGPFLADTYTLDDRIP